MNNFTTFIFLSNDKIKKLNSELLELEMKNYFRKL